MASARKAEIERQLSDLAAHRRWLQAEDEKFTTAYVQLVERGSELVVRGRVELPTFRFSGEI